MHSNQMWTNPAAVKASVALAALLLATPALAQNSADRVVADGQRALVDMRFDDAAKQFEKAASLEPRSSMIQVWLGRAYARLAQKASLFKQAGLAKKTRTTWQNAIALDPNNLDAREALGEFYLMAPGIVGGSEAKALAEVGEIAKRDPARGAVARGRIHEKRKEWADAERLYKSAQPKAYKSATTRLGYVYQEQKHWDKMFDVFEDALKSDPRNTWALYHIGKASALSGQRLDRGEQALLAYLRTTPEIEDAQPAQAQWRLGMIYEAGRDPAKARAAYRAAQRLNPRHAASAAALKKLK